MALLHMPAVCAVFLAVLCSVHVSAFSVSITGTAVHSDASKTYLRVRQSTGHSDFTISFTKSISDPQTPQTVDLTGFLDSFAHVAHVDGTSEGTSLNVALTQSGSDPALYQGTFRVIGKTDPDTRELTMTLNCDSACTTPTPSRPIWIETVAPGTIASSKSSVSVSFGETTVFSINSSFAAVAPITISMNPPGYVSLPDGNTAIIHTGRSSVSVSVTGQMQPVTFVGDIILSSAVSHDVAFSGITPNVTSIPVNLTYNGGHMCGRSPAGGYSLGQQVPICIVQGTKKWAFTARVDQYSRLFVAGLYNNTLPKSFDNVTNPLNTTYTRQNISLYSVDDATTVSSQQPLRPYILPPESLFPTAGQHVVQIMTVLVRLVKGVVTQLEWDEGCLSCPSQFCYEGFCGEPTSECQVAANATGILQDASSCDLQLYVAWVGTDVNGINLKSAGMVFSRFRSYSVANLYNSARCISVAGVAMTNC